MQTETRKARTRWCPLNRLTRPAAGAVQARAAKAGAAVAPWGGAANRLSEGNDPSPILEPAERDPVEWERPRVVAEVLSDGTVQILDRAVEGRSEAPWATGQISGSGWTIWWERRRWG
jgi:hypothetical protein